MGEKIGIMQPYLFPYLGYFQLIAAVDVFVISDDLQYINKGWINKNRILVNGEDHAIHFPLKKADHLQRINERVLAEDYTFRKGNLLKTISQAYCRAKYFKQAFTLIERIIDYHDNRLAIYIENSLREICIYLEIDTPILRSSELPFNPELRNQKRVIETVKLLDGDTYINPIGGTCLYSFDEFRRNGMTLLFHRMDDIRYPQYGKGFIPNLSIIDVMMFNDVDEIQELLRRCSLIGESSRQDLFTSGRQEFNREAWMVRESSSP
jgi:hypothetical protein